MLFRQKFLGQEKLQFKVNVRKLKALGLTESLETISSLAARRCVPARR